MLRRHVPSTTPPSRGPHSQQGQLRGVGRFGSKRSHDASSSPRICSVWFLLALAGLITLATYLFPEEMAEVEVNAAREINAVEEEIANWLWKPREPPIPEHLHPHFVESKDDATKRITEQESKWVDGEKKLKAKLKVLIERQKQGLDIGVPVLTRYLGEDIPAWPSEGMDKQEWEKKVEQRYAEMRKEEEEWKAKISVLLNDEKRG